MGVTQFSFILLPLCLLWALKPTRLLHLMIVATIFESAAAVNVGSLGVQPGLVPAAMFIGFIALQLLLGAQYPGAAQAWHISKPFVVVTLWAIVGSIVMPRLLQGQVLVWPQKVTPPFALIPLAPDPGNINQDCYIAVDCCMLVMTALFLTRPSVPLRPFITTYHWTGFLVAALAIWQLASKLAGVPYPNDLFYSNPGVAILTLQTIGFVPRINGPFTEPSSLGGYMSGIVCSCGWLLLQRHEGWTIRALLIVALAMIMLSTSTTGFGVLAIIGVGVPTVALARGNARIIAGILKVGMPFIVVGIISMFAASVVQPTILTNAKEVLESTLNKQESSSYQDRTGADLDSITAFEDSFGLGVGWGSNRSSSLLPGLSANLGIPGMAALIWFGVRLTRHVGRARLSASRDQMFVIDACCGSLTGTMLAACLSGPTISWVSFFFLIGLLIACVVRVEMESRLRSRLMAASANASRDQSVAAGAALTIQGYAPGPSGRL